MRTPTPPSSATTTQMLALSCNVTEIKTSSKCPIDPLLLLRGLNTTAKFPCRVLSRFSFVLGGFSYYAVIRMSGWVSPFLDLLNGPKQCFVVLQWVLSMGLDFSMGLGIWWWNTLGSCEAPLSSNSSLYFTFLLVMLWFFPFCDWNNVNSCSQHAGWRCRWCKDVAVPMRVHGDEFEKVTIHMT